MRRTRSSDGMNFPRTLSIVVFPVPVPPAMRMFFRARMLVFELVGKPTFQSPRLNEFFDAKVPGVELADRQSDAVHAARWNDGSDAAAIGSRESRIGFDSEMSSPSRRAIFFTATIRDFSPRWMPGTGSTNPCFSMKMWSGPLTMTSLMELSRIRCWIGLRNGRIVFESVPLEFSVRKLAEVGFVHVVVVGLEVAKHRGHRVRAVIGDGLRTARYAVP